MHTDIAVIDRREVVITTEQTELIKRTICQGATDAEMQLFFYDCQRRGVHPLDKLIHFTKRAGKYTPITSIDFMRQRAQASGVFVGEDEPVYTYLSSGAVDTCLYAVYRLVHGQRCKWTATARWEEYYPGDQLGFMWKKMPTLMLAKCAEALALRKAFPAELQGLYVKEEMEQAGPARSFVQPDPAQTDGVGTETLTGPQQASDASAPQSDPSEPYKVKLRTCERTPQAITHAFNAIPEEIRQDCHLEFQTQLRSLDKRPKKKDDMDWDRVARTAYSQSVTHAASSIKRFTGQTGRWRRLCLIRDGYACVLCHSTHDLEVHHIVRWIDAPLLRLKKCNGATLCHECHSQWHCKVGSEFPKDISLRLVKATSDNARNQKKKPESCSE